MGANNRFTKPVYSLVEFSDEVWVKCPRCGEKGLTRKKINFKNNIARTYLVSFHCAKCSLIHEYSGDWWRRRELDQSWYGLAAGSIARACSFCGTRFKYNIRLKREEIGPITIKCKSCQKEISYQLDWYASSGGEPEDPNFGMELWLQIPVKGNVLWAYNLEHIHYLREYINSTLRESNGKHKYSMIFNLPNWMILAKNREVILKKLAKLEEIART